MLSDNKVAIIFLGKNLSIATVMVVDIMTTFIMGTITERI